MYCSARAPDANEDYTALAKPYPTPPASAGLVHANGYVQLSEEAFLRDFAGDIDPGTARALYAVQGRADDRCQQGERRNGDEQEQRDPAPRLVNWLRNFSSF